LYAKFFYRPKAQAVEPILIRDTPTDVTKMHPYP